MKKLFNDINHYLGYYTPSGKTFGAVVGGTAAVTGIYGRYYLFDPISGVARITYDDNYTSSTFFKELYISKNHYHQKYVCLNQNESYFNPKLSNDTIEKAYREIVDDA